MILNGLTTCHPFLTFLDNFIKKHNTNWIAAKDYNVEKCQVFNHNSEVNKLPKSSDHSSNGVQ